MNRDEVLALAREAAFHTPVMEGELLRFVALVVSAERERCADIAETAAQHWYEFAMAKDSRVEVGATAHAAAKLVAKAIREGKTP